MMGVLTPLHQKNKEKFISFINSEIAPVADKIDKTGKIPRDLINKIAEQGYLGAIIDKEYNGLGLDPISTALLHEEMGKYNSSLENMLTVSGMVAKALSSAGSEEQKSKWLPQIASGQTIVSFSITEPDTGSDIKEISTTAKECGDHYILNGVKKWATLGQIADLFLIFAKCNDRGAAFLVERNTPGLTVVPMPETFGLRANMLAEIHLEDCMVPKDNLVGKVGTGLTRVAANALDEGRFTTACGCLGLGQACLEASLKYVGKRKQFNVYLKEHQLVQKMITEMVVSVKASRLLCYQAGYLRSIKDPGAITETLLAKYHASKTANLAAGYAVQIHGALGCSSEYAVERFYRDAKIMEIIEGSSQIYEILIAKNALL